MFDINSSYGIHFTLKHIKPLLTKNSHILKMKKAPYFGNASMALCPPLSPPSSPPPRKH